MTPARTAALAVTFAALSLRIGAAAADPPPTAAVRHDSFFVGGVYVEAGGQQMMHGQMFAEMLTPEHVTHPYPLVLIHGLAQTAMNWMTTPDGREGWADWFATHGWRVVMIDQPARGRSAWQPGIDGAVKTLPASLIQRMFTAPEDSNGWPQARLHTQWPGAPEGGHIGNPIFDQFYASQVASLGNAESERLMQQAGAALLDRIGPAVLLTHSQAGAFGWSIADARPALVKGIVAIEPMGPPYKDALFQTGADRAWGITNIPLAYAPPVTEASPLHFIQQPKPDAPDLAACWSQAAPARTLPHLAGIPILIATTEASYHAGYDHCTARYLAEAGVPNEFVRLADHGLHGNAHMLMLEKNNLEIAAFLDGWMTAHIH